MTDTPEHIKDLQLKLWLAKTPGERLLQFITDNDIMFQGLIAFKTMQSQKVIGKDASNDEKFQVKAKQK